MQMQNVKYEIEDKKLMIEVDLTENLGRSRSGKSIIIGSSKGNQSIEFNGETIYLGINVYKLGG